MNHALLPSVAHATLPVKYEAAKLALAECNRVDECKDWADKTAALASYCKQSGDKTMENVAMRIRARAIQRCGQLLQEIKKASGKRTDLQPSGGSPTRLDAAAQAGMSKDQAVTAIRVARVNGDSFEEQVESDDPPTITALADQGKAAAVPDYVRLGMTIEAFQAGMHFGRGALVQFAKRTEEFDPRDVVAGTPIDEREDLIRYSTIVINYLNELIQITDL